MVVRGGDGGEERIHYLKTEEELSQYCEENENTLHVKLKKTVLLPLVVSCISFSLCIVRLFLPHLDLRYNNPSPGCCFELLPKAKL